MAPSAEISCNDMIPVFARLRREEKGERGERKGGKEERRERRKERSKGEGKERERSVWYIWLDERRRGIC